MTGYFKPVYGSWNRRNPAKPAHNLRQNINSNPDPVKEVRKITSEQGADFVIEMTGDPTVVKQGIEMLRIGGKYVILGAIYPNSNITIDVSMIILKCIEIFGMHNYHPSNLKKAIELVVESKKKFPYEKLVGPDFPLSVQGVEDALTFLNSKGVPGEDSNKTRYFCR